MKMADDAKARRTQQIFSVVVVLLLLAAAAVFLRRAEAIDYDTGSKSDRKKAGRMQSKPSNFVPPAAIKLGGNEARKARKVNESIRDTILQEHLFFRSFLPEAWTNSTSWKASEVPSNDENLNTFRSAFAAQLVNKELVALKEALGPRLKDDALKAIGDATGKLDVAVKNAKSEDKDEALAKLAAGMKIMRDHQKSYWIVEAICQIAAADRTANLPLLIESISMPVRSRESILVHSQQGARGEKVDVPYGAFEVRVTVLIDQRDIPQFLARMRKGLEQVKLEGDALVIAKAKTANARGSRHLMLTVRKDTLSRLSGEEAILFFKESGAAKAFDKLGILDLDGKTDDGDGDGDDEDEEDGDGDDEDNEDGITPSQILKILRGDLLIKAKSEKVENTVIRPFLAQFRFPSRYTVTFTVTDYNRDYKLGVAAKKTSKRRRNR